ncbi:MAG: hypothetical protein ACRC3B_20825 [Bacteroidia bacterium]
MNPRIASVCALLLSILLLTAFLLPFFFNLFSSFNSLWALLILYLLNFSLQWWLMKWISVLEDDTEEKTGLRILARAMLLLIPAFYIFGSIALVVLGIIYLLSYIWR